MSVELLTWVAVVLLLAAAAACTMVQIGRQRPWPAVVLFARLGSVVALGLALSLEVAARDQWSPLDSRQVALGLAAATAVLHLGLALLSRSACGSRLVDILVSGLAVVAMVVIPVGGPALTCFQRSFPYQVEWALFLLGAGGMLVAGGTAPFLVRRRQTPPLPGLDLLLVHSTFLASLILGSGILVGLWWAWRATGTLAAGDARESWMAVPWLLTAMSLLSWQLGRHAGRWAAWLAMAAAVMALFGLLALPDVQQWLGS